MKHPTHKGRSSAERKRRPPGAGGRDAHLLDRGDPQVLVAAVFAPGEQLALPGGVGLQH